MLHDCVFGHSESTSPVQKIMKLGETLYLALPIANLGNF